MRVVVKQILTKQFFTLIGPILLSALSIFISFLILQPFALFLDPSFNLLASRGIGKIAFTTLIILQIFLLLIMLPKPFLDKLLKTNIYFFKEKKFLKEFFAYFLIFFTLHAFFLFTLTLSGFASYNANWGNFNISLILKIFSGFLATFFLAWTEELIFRGTLYPYFAQKLTHISSIILTSTIFMFAHNITNPLDLITKNWRLGLGLFLLGTLLNLIFFHTKKLYTGMGAHAGLVFVKVILRRMPIIITLKDLRTSHIAHLLFFIAILFFAIKSRKKLLK